MSITKFLLSLFFTAIVLTACDKRPDVNQCVDPKMLRVKVGDVIFDLPKSVQMPSADSSHEDRKPEKFGIIKFESEDHFRDHDIRLECNSKNLPVADFRDGMEMVYRGDGSEPIDYRLGDQLYAIMDIVRYNPASHRRDRKEYLSDVEDIENVKFVGRTDRSRQGVERIKSATFSFSHNDRLFSLNCQVGWYDSPSENANLKVMLPSMCIPRATFRVGNILISTTHHSYRSKKNNFDPIPPEEWPKQWAFIVGKILDMRVKHHN